jgi:hypothetical protein
LLPKVQECTSIVQIEKKGTPCVRPTMFKTRSDLAEVQLKPTAPLDPPAFPFTLPAIRSLERLPLHPNVTFLVGENGSPAPGARLPAAARWLLPACRKFL